MAQRKRDLLACELRLLHAKPPASVSFDFARFLSFSLEAFSGTGSLEQTTRGGRTHGVTEYGNDYLLLVELRDGLMAEMAQSG